jgi:peptide/nickel transport system substrate-binding protein
MRLLSSLHLRLGSFVLAMALLVACGGAPAAPGAAPSASPAGTSPDAPASTAAPTDAPASAATATSPPEPTAATSLRVAILRDEGLLQPYSYVTGYPGWNMLSLVYDALFVMDAQNLPKPWLATEHTVSDDGLVHTITLHSDVTWHDGEPLTSADVKFAYEYYQQNTHSRWTSQVDTITAIETPDPTTVVIMLDTAAPAFEIQPLADVPIIPRHIWEGVTEPDTFANNVGSGPYTLTEYLPDQLYRFTANAEHFAGAPAVGELLMPIIKEPNTIFSALRTGEIQATTVPLSPELVQEFQSVPTLKVQSGPGYATTMLQFNTERAPWDNVEVRRAVALAIDVQKLVDTILLGYGVPGSPGWVSPASPLHNPAVTGTYDPAQAAALLDELGYLDSDNDGIREANGTPMQAELLVQSSVPLRIRAAEIIAADLEDLGIRLTVTAMEPDSVVAKVWPDFDVANERDYDLAMWGWSAPLQLSPTRMADLVHSDPSIGSTNIGGFTNADADALATQLLETTDATAQQELSYQMEALIADQLPFVMLYYADGIYAYAPAAYDGWIFQTGQGIFHKLSFQPEAAPE